MKNISKMTDQEKIKELHDLLYDCLSSANQEGGIHKIRGIEDGKLVVELSVVEVPEDNYIGFDWY